MEIPVHLRLHPRLDRRRRGRPDAPAGRAARRRCAPSPGSITLRPADANEVVEAWRVIMPLRHEPVGADPHRGRPLPTLDRSALRAGRRPRARAPTCWPTRHGGKPEVHPDRHRQRGVAVRRRLRAADRRGHQARVVSMPSWELFEQQTQDVPRRACCRRRSRRASRSSRPSTFGWERYVGLTGAVIGMQTFGASAPLKELQKKFGFTRQRARARRWRKRN